MEHDYPTTDKRLIIRYLATISTRIKKMERMPAGELTGNQLLMLPLIASFDTVPNLGELAQRSETSYQNTRNLLEKLSDAGYVILAPDKHDYRTLRVSLTDKGKEAVDDYYEHIRDSVSNIFRDLDESDIEATQRVLATLLNRIGELHPPEKH